MANIRKRGASYQIRVSCGYDARGEQIVQTMTWKPPEGITEKQAEKEVKRQAFLFEEKCMKGQVSANIKFEEFAKQWFEEYAKLNLRSTSFQRMRQAAQRVYPAIGQLRLDKITSRIIQQFINDLFLNSKNCFTGEPLSRKTVVHHLSFISDVFGYAVKMGMLTDNPCCRVSVPKGEKKEKQIYTPEEVEQFFGLLNEAPLKYRVFFTLAVYSGFRRGELLGLEWKDIDWAGGIISVRRTSNYAAGYGTYTDTTKTKKSQRSLKFPPVVMDLLKEYKAAQDEEKAEIGSRWIDHDRLFVQWNGKPMGNSTPYRWLRQFCENHNFRFCDIHSMRHTFATMALENGMDVKTLSTTIGHVSSETTIDIYSHITDTMQRQAAAKIDRQIGGTEAEIPKGKELTRQNADPAQFEPYKPKIRKSGTGCVTMINDHLFEGRYSPRNAYGKREAHNIYAKTREECEEKLAAMIIQVKAEIKAEKERLKTVNESFSLEIR